MSTVLTETPAFVIDARANSKLAEFSGDLSKILLEMASRLTSNRTQHGIPLVDVCDIESAAHVLCNVIKRGVQSGDLPDKSGEVLEQLQVVCRTFAHECEQQSTAAAFAADTAR